jgi:hypothetical protein
MYRAVRFAVVALLGGLMVAVVPFARMALATGTDCSDVGHRTSGATYDAWFTPDEHDTASNLIDHLWDVDPTVPSSTVADSAVNDPWITAPGHIMRGWMHVCLPLTGHYVAILLFKDTSDNPNWNDRSDNPASSQGRTDVVTGQFFQVVPDEDSANGFQFRPKIEQNLQPIFSGNAFVVTISGTAIAPPTHQAGPSNGSCSTGFRAELRSDGSEGALFDVAGTRNVAIHRFDQVAQDANLNGNIWYCGDDNQVHAVAIKLIPISTGTDIAPWESEVYSPGTFSTSFQ